MSHCPEYSNMVEPICNSKLWNEWKDEWIDEKKETPDTSTNKQLQRKKNDIEWTKKKQQKYTSM